MKNILCAMLTLFVLSLQAQQKYFTKTGKTSFSAIEKSFEPVAATNQSTTVLLNTETGDIAALLFVNAFHFKVALMQEHFNENYMDAHKFPKSTFKGTIEDFNMEELKENAQQKLITGVLKIKNVAKEIKTKAKVAYKQGKIVLDANFVVSAQDFGIEIPKIVRHKLSKDITVTLHYELEKK